MADCRPSCCLGTPLAVAAVAGHTECVRVALNAGAHSRAPAFVGQRESIQTSKPAKSSRKGGRGKQKQKPSQEEVNTACLQAAFVGQTATLMEMIDADAVVSGNGIPGVYFSLLNGHFETAECLVQFSHQGDKQGVATWAQKYLPTLMPYFDEMYCGLSAHFVLSKGACE